MAEVAADKYKAGDRVIVTVEATVDYASPYHDGVNVNINGLLVAVNTSTLKPAPMQKPLPGTVIRYDDDGIKVRFVVTDTDDLWRIGLGGVPFVSSYRWSNLDYSKVQVLA